MEGTAERLRIALYQGPGRWQDKAAALAQLEALAAAAAGRGAGLLVCPEMFLTGYNIGPEAAARLAEPAEGPCAQAAGAIARAHRIALCFGFPEAAAGAMFNAAALIGPDGRSLATYRKTHLFGAVDRAMFAAGGEGVVLAPLFGLCVGMLICYDVEFPETVRALALAGADLVLVPTAAMRPYEVVARALIPARAYENQIFCAYANRSGAEPPFDYFGESVVAGPDGAALTRAGAGEEMLFADLDPTLLAAVRARDPMLADRRPALYQALAAARSPGFTAPVRPSPEHGPKPSPSPARRAGFGGG